MVKQTELPYFGEEEHQKLQIKCRSFDMIDSDSLPSKWRIRKLGDICSLRKELIRPENAGEMAYVGLENIESGESQIKTWGKSSDVKSVKYSFYDGDILYGKLRPYLDKCAIACRNGICSTDICVLQVFPKVIVRTYLVNVMHTSSFLNYAAITMSGVNHPRTSWSELKKFRIPLPPLSEQRKIAAILTSIDETIQKTQLIIEETQRLKRGLMQLLFTKGIGHTKFKKTRMGEIPEEWNVVKLGDITRRITKGTTPTTYGFQYSDSGVKFIKIESINNLGEIELEKLAYIDKEADEKLRRSRLKEDDILFSIAGQLGKTCIISDEILPANTNQALAIIRLSKEAAVRFLFYYLNGEEVRRWISRVAIETARTNINLGQLADLTCPLPPHPEQQKIAAILSSIDEKTQKEEQYKSQLQILKKGLMQDLLMGKVRVKVEN